MRKKIDNEKVNIIYFRYGTKYCRRRERDILLSYKIKLAL